MERIQLNIVRSFNDYMTYYIDKFMDIEERKTLVIYSADTGVQILQYKELFIDTDDDGNVISIDLWLNKSL